MMSLGKLVYNVYHKPLAAIRQTLKTGVRRTAEMNAGRKAMMTAAAGVGETVYPGAPTHQVYFLTGERYWFQTAFCLHSLQKVAGVNIQSVVVDDGSITDDLAAQMQRQFPSTLSVVRADALQRHLDETLPASRFPVLRQRRIVYPHLRKLTDIHVLPGEGPKLVLDSDMLFFHRPTAMLDWLAKPNGMLFMRDVEESYGYSAALMNELCGAAIPEQLNVGVAGMESSAVDWTKLEQWTDVLLQREGSSYLQEQALTAMLAAGRPHSFLDEHQYKVLPAIKGNDIPETLHHYVADAKYDYFVKGWKRFVSVT